MIINIARAEDVTVTCGNAGPFTVDINKLPQEALAYIFAYGLKQCLNDSRSAAKTEGEAQGMVQKKLDALYAGTIRSVSTRTSDPVMAEAKRLATAILKTKKIKREQLTDDQYAKLVEKFMEQAKVNVAQTANLVGDLSDLGL